MHVLYFHQHFSTPQGSAGTRSYEMAQALLREGHSVKMVCGSYAQGTTGLSGPFVRGKRTGVVNGIDIIEFNLDYGNHMGIAQRLGVFVKFAFGSIGVAMREPADVVFATTTPLTAGIPGIFARWLRRKPFVFEVRDLWPELPKAMGVITNPLVLWLMSALEWISYHSANRLIALSPGIVDGITSRGINKSLIAMVPNGCDIALFADSASAWRPKEVQKDDLLAVFTGTHGPANGLDALLDVAAILKKRGCHNIKIALIGQGREKKRLVQRAYDEQLENILFLDPVPKTKLVGLMKGADIGLQVLRNVPAFYYGTSPNKFFDYIAAGLPVINNYPGWLASLISKSECGFVVAPDDPVAFAEKLIEVAQKKEVLEVMSNNALSLAHKEFDRKLLANKWIDSIVYASRC